MTAHAPASPLFHDPVYGHELCAAYSHARRLGLCPDDAEDCAMHLLLRRLERGVPPGPDTPLRRRCARDFATDWWRAHARRTRREVSLSGLCGSAAVEGAPNETSARVVERAGGGPLPEQALLTLALSALVDALLLQLRPGAARLVRGHYLDGDSVGELADATAQTPHAVEQALYRSRRRLRDLLDAEGLGVLDLV